MAPEPWYPGATRNPGAATGYAFDHTHPFGFADGHNLMQVAKCHYTVGVDSTGRGLEGYFQFLVSRDGLVQQFCEADAYCWDSGEENKYGPGIEVEYLNELSIFTDEARVACSGLIHWLSTTWGIPLTYHDGVHDTELGASGYRGFISHHALIQTEEHQDYWPQSDWDAMVRPVPPTPPEDDDMPKLVHYSIRDDADHEVGTGRDVYGVLCDGEAPMLDAGNKNVPYDLYTTIHKADWDKAKG